MILAVNSAFARKTDWSKVGLYSSNKCNDYTFELKGIDTNCMSYRYVEITNAESQVFLRKQNGSRVYKVTLPAKGKYYATVLIMNKCNGDDTLWVDTINVTCIPAPKCNWTGIYLGYGLSCNVYKFEVTGTSDTCWKTTSFIYSYKTEKITDTFYTRTFTKVFSDTGKYKVYTKVLNKCTGCDTTIYNGTWVTCKPTSEKCDWSKAGFTHINKCGTVTFEMGSYIDGCTKYRTIRYAHKTGISDTIGGSRIFTKTMDTGLYSFKTFFINKCTGCDTFIYKPNIYIGCEPASAVSTATKVDFQIVPNPGYDYIEIRYEGQELPVSIHDPAGRVVYKGSTADMEIDVQNFSEGVYTILVGRTQKKIWISR